MHRQRSRRRRQRGPSAPDISGTGPRPRAALRGPQRAYKLAREATGALCALARRCPRSWMHERPTRYADTLGHSGLDAEDLLTSWIGGNVNQARSPHRSRFLSVDSGR